VGSGLDIVGTDLAAFLRDLGGIELHSGRLVGGGSGKSCCKVNALT
jgi:hypothetical protein